VTPGARSHAPDLWRWLAWNAALISQCRASTAASAVGSTLWPFGGVRIIGVSDGYDSQSKSRKVQRGVRGLMNEIYLDDLKDKVHRGLAGQAIKKFWAGGKPYGYRLVQMKDESHLDPYGNPSIIGTHLAIDPDQAEIVRKIFTLYASDHSQRAIAAALNERRVPSPGASWRGRTVRRASGWLGSTINSLLPNELYRGRMHWNKTEWRKNPDTGRRTTRSRPQSEWISHDMPELRIIEEALWERVIARRERASIRGAKRARSIAESRPYRPRRSQVCVLRAAPMRAVREQHGHRGRHRSMAGLWLFR